MEAIEEPPLNNSPVDNIKVSVVCDETDENAKTSAETDVCHKSNGVAELTDSGVPATSEPKPVIAEKSKTDTKTTENLTEIEKSDVPSDTVEPAGPSTSEPDTTSIPTVDSSSTVETTLEKSETSTVIEGPQKIEKAEIDVDMQDATVEVEHVVESSMDRVTFETEILVESNDNEIVETVYDESKTEGQDTHNILSELGENIVLSEALRSSDVTDNIENNNCSARQEVFNKEELLDILEGNNEDASPYGGHIQPMRSDKILEAQLALQQLTRLKSKSRLNKRPTKSQSIERFPKNRSDKRIAKKVTNPTQAKNEENIVHVLVKEWDDEDGPDIEKTTQLEEAESLIKSTDDVVKAQESVIKNEESLRTSVDSQSADAKTPAASKSGDEGQPQRRLGRVIKKKVIFDPDNPDTFTKSKIIVKNKESSQEIDQTVPKKIKTEQAFQRSKSKSPLRKMQWKKPSPKNSKQNKRLTEIDKLLMDEGAVNMIYQLTPEAPKGKKNMKTKAEFIKKIQSSSTPDTKEMKFRERKKECRYEDPEARRILGGKHRPSLNSSVKSPSVSEDFEAHSADDSIIYRRHSSSSYSSSCLSPRRLSDVDTGSQNTTRTSQHTMEMLQKSNVESNNEHPPVDMFMSDSVDIVKTETINKDDCLLIKEKLNSKLNLALNKRKRENSKTDKPSKQKKVMKDKHESSSEDKYLSLRLEGKLAVICVQKAGSLCDVEILKELENLFKLIDSRKDISVTLLMPECGVICSDLDLRSLLDDNAEIRTSNGGVMADAVRSLLYTVGKHSKLLCAGVSGRCTGISLALIGLSDVALASERASFAISAKSRQTLVEPGVSVITAYRDLPQSVVTDLVVFGRRLSASDALQSGLVCRTLWPEKFNEQVLAIAKEIAAQPQQTIWLKKQMLGLKKLIPDPATFTKRLDKERDLFVEYWTSAEGQEILSATYNVA